LPIELNVEKKKGKVGHKIDANSFRAECRKYADTQVNKQKQNTQQYIYMFIDKINACKTYICAVINYYKLN
jgi:isoleucyl-tRNA synthetase